MEEQTARRLDAQVHVNLWVCERVLDELAHLLKDSVHAAEARIPA